MQTRSLEIALPVQLDRHFPASAAFDLARAYRASGVVDYLQGWDQMAGWCPPHLWNPQNAPLYSMRPDADSLPDQYSLMSAMVGAAPGLGASISTDCIRRGPSEMMQTMLTMANLTEGKAQFHIGAGEIKQLKPYGWNRSEGWTRLEDLFKLIKLYWEEDEPFAFEGNHWKLDGATLGYARAHKPQIWGIGGGPKMIDLATTYADGFGTMGPWVAHTPERWHEMVTDCKNQLEHKGRDPDAFAFGLYASSLIHEDHEVIRKGMENPLIKWMTACLGRFNMADWRVEGLEPPLPDKWHYSRNLLAHHISQSEVRNILDRVTPQMSNAGWFHGTPQEVAADLQAYVDAGATWISVIDILPMVLDPADGANALARSFEVAGMLRANTGRVVEPVASN